MKVCVLNVFLEPKPRAARNHEAKVAVLLSGFPSSSVNSLDLFSSWPDYAGKKLVEKYWRFISWCGTVFFGQFWNWFKFLFLINHISLWQSWSFSFYFPLWKVVGEKKEFWSFCVWHFGFLFRDSPKYRGVPRTTGDAWSATLSCVRTTLPTRWTWAAPWTAPLPWASASRAAKWPTAAGWPPSSSASNAAVWPSSWASSAPATRFSSGTLSLCAASPSRRSTTSSRTAATTPSSS